MFGVSEKYRNILSLKKKDGLVIFLCFVGVRSDKKKLDFVRYKRANIIFNFLRFFVLPLSRISLRFHLGRCLLPPLEHKSYTKRLRKKHP